MACGFIHPEDDLSRLKALYVPHWVMWKPEWTPQVEAFVAAGGTLILSALTGTRDSDNHIHRVQAPGAGLSELAGVKVYEFGRLTGPEADGLFTWRESKVNGGHVSAIVPSASSSGRKYQFTFGNQQFTAAHLYEKLELAEDTKSLGQWSNSFLAGTPAITCRRHGGGQVIYVGTYLTADLATQLVETVLEPQGVKPLIADLPQGVEVTVRQSEDRELFFILNTGAEAVTLFDAPHGKELLSGSAAGGALNLGPYGCAIIRRARKT